MYVYHVRRIYDNLHITRQVTENTCQYYIQTNILFTDIKQATDSIYMSKMLKVFKKSVRLLGLTLTSWQAKASMKSNMTKHGNVNIGVRQDTAVSAVVLF
jgi:hypothetical protein